MDARQEALFDEHMGWASSLARRCRQTRIGFDVLQNAALLGLFVAATKCTNEIQNFKGFAFIYVKGHLVDCVRQELGLRMYRGKRINPVEAFEVLPELPFIGRCHEEMKEDVEHSLKQFTPKQRRLLTDYYIRHKPMLQIAKEQGLTEARISQQLKAILGGERKAN